MWEFLDLLRWVARGERQWAIGQVTDHSCSTLRRRLRVSCEVGWEPGQGEPDEALADPVAKRGRPVADEAAPEESQPRLLPARKEPIQAGLVLEEEECRGLRLTRVRQLLARQDVEVLYGSLHRFAVQHRGPGWVCRQIVAERLLRCDACSRSFLTRPPETGAFLGECYLVCVAFNVRRLAALTTARDSGRILSQASRCAKGRSNSILCTSDQWEFGEITSRRGEATRWLVSDGHSFQPGAHPD